MRQRSIFNVFAFLFFMALMAQASPAMHPAGERESDWIWAGIDVPEDHESRNLFLYQGAFFQKSHGIEFARRGLYPHRLIANEVHLVFRLENLDGSEGFKNTVLMIISHWEQRKTLIRGVQLDFDSPTGKLERYYLFLKEVRNWLPPRYRLTITGLGDWLLLDRPQVLHALCTCVDEIVFQLYSGRRYVPGLERYVARLEKLDIPFKVGLLSGRDENKQVDDRLRRNPHYRGCVYFIQAS